MSRRSREIIHDLAALPDIAVATARQEAANLTVQLLGPIVEHGGKLLVNAIKKKISGKNG